MPTTEVAGDSTRWGRNQYPSAPKLLGQIRRAINSAKGAVILTFENVDVETGSSIAKSLDAEAETEGRTYRYGIYLSVASM
jgi:hypothetical protein